MAETPSTRKVQITVPAADISVVEWLDLQYSASESIRRLIREAIAREGFVDVANRPVRPPAQPVHIAEDLSFERDARPAAPVAVEPVAVAPAPAEDPAPADGLAAPEDSTPQPPEKQRPQAVDTNASATIDDLLGL
ncbi:hypothetical protein WDU99_14805 [Microbacterium sp. Mu-80]|uniref:CopG family transcriptional regulator n=1 Tax=Microbacterium bandirmense TaxID=3122050 RepID=A0ABU8LE26_9MICO